MDDDVDVAEQAAQLDAKLMLSCALERNSRTRACEFLWFGYRAYRHGLAVGGGSLSSCWPPIGRLAMLVAPLAAGPMGVRVMISWLAVR